MDSNEAAKIVLDRIKQLEPNVATKIIGFIYLQDIPNHDMIRFALGPDSLILNLIQNAKTALFSPSLPIIPPFYFPNDCNFKSSCFPNEYYSQEAAINNMSIRTSRNSSNVTDYSVKTCHYFVRGFCKHGSNCRYYHGESYTNSYPRMFGSNPYEDQVFYPLSLEKLEFEIIELLKSRKGHPISIASLPMMYFERYGKTLQAEGYLTESQRHGKAGYNLTKLLAQLKNIRLVDRPHGQHAVMLAEDVVKYIEIRPDGYDSSQIVNGSRQIYLTFPAESIFTEEDVSNYFSSFGPVQDVRIPFQQKRMFGFVTFVSAYTVELILSQGNPHYICGARVLVKPYREKSKLAERKYIKEFENPMYYHPIEIDSDLESRFSYQPSRRQLMEDHEKALELETRHLSLLRLAPKPLASESCFDCSDQESAQGLNLPDSPFASAVASSISALIYISVENTQETCFQLTELKEVGITDRYDTAKYIFNEVLDYIGVRT